MRSPCGRLAAAVTAAAGLTGHAGGGHAIHHRYSAARQHYVKTALSGPEVTPVKHWLRWSARHKWVSRSLARDEWIARTSDDQIVLNVTACKLALTTRAHDFLTANDGPNFLRAARALSVHVPPGADLRSIRVLRVLRLLPHHAGRALHAGARPAPARRQDGP